MKFIMLLATLMVLGCDNPGNPNKARRGQLKLEPERGINISMDDAVTIHYAYDPQTDLCFAYMREGGMGPALAHVPCESLKMHDMPRKSLPTIVSK